MITNNQLIATNSLAWSGAYTPDFRTWVGNLRPAWTFDMASVRILVTQFRIQNHIKTKLH